MRPGSITAVLPLLLAGACASTPARDHAGAPSAQRQRGGAITGVVTDAASGEPISFVSVEATRSAYNANDTTGGEGRYAIGGLADGTYEVTASYGDHTMHFSNVPVVLGKQTRIDIPMDTSQLRSRGELDYVEWNPTIKKQAPGADAATPRAAATNTTAQSGRISGIIRDEATGELLPGAVVAATTPGLRDAQLAIAGDNGRFRHSSLPPGTYTLSVYYHVVDRGNIEVRRTGVTVVAGKTTVIDLNLDAKRL